MFLNMIYASENNTTTKLHFVFLYYIWRNCSLYFKDSFYSLQLLVHLCNNEYVTRNEKNYKQKELLSCISWGCIFLFAYSWDKHTKTNCTWRNAKIWDTSVSIWYASSYYYLIIYIVKLQCRYVYTFWWLFHISKLYNTRCAEVSCIWLLVKHCIHTSAYKTSRSQSYLFVICEAISIIYYNSVAITCICWNQNTKLMRHLFSDVGQVTVNGILKQYTAYRQWSHSHVLKHYGT